MGLIFNGVIESGWITETSKFYGLMSVPFWQHLIIGSIYLEPFIWQQIPLTASQTNKGKWIYGFLIGFISFMIRVFNLHIRKECFSDIINERFCTNDRSLCNTRQCKA